VVCPDNSRADAAGGHAGGDQRGQVPGSGSGQLLEPCAFFSLHGMDGGGAGAHMDKSGRQDWGADRNRRADPHAGRRHKGRRRNVEDPMRETAAPGVGGRVKAGIHTRAFVWEPGAGGRQRRGQALFPSYINEGT